MPKLNGIKLLDPSNKNVRKQQMATDAACLFVPGTCRVVLVSYWSPLVSRTRLLFKLLISYITGFPSTERPTDFYHLQGKPHSARCQDRCSDAGGHESTLYISFHKTMFYYIFFYNCICRFFFRLRHWQGYCVPPRKWNLFH